MEQSTTRSGRPIRPVRAIMADMVSQDEVKQLIEAARNQLIADLTSQNRLLPSGGTSTATAPSTSTSSASPQFVTDPYESNFNPGEKLGADLFKTATAPLKDSERFNLTQDKAAAFLRVLKDKNQAFKWGFSVNRIPQDYPATLDNQKSLLLQPNLVSLLSVQREAARCWGGYDTKITPLPPLPSKKVVKILDYTKDEDKALFYEQIRRTMVAKTIFGMLKPSAYQTIMLKKDEFSWTTVDGIIKYDGPTILKLIFLEINPSTKISLQDYKSVISKASLDGYRNNVSEMLNSMQKAYHHIVENEGTHDDYLLHIIDAIMTSKNKIFKDYMQTFKNRWQDDDATITAVFLIEKAKNKYHNLVKENEWDKNDTSDAKLVALQTRFQKFVNGKSNSSKQNSTSRSTKQQNNKGKDQSKNTNWKPIDPRRCTKTSDSKKIDGVQYWWCPDHYKEGEYDGLYMPHKPGSEHDAWAAKNKESDYESVGVPVTFISLITLSVIKSISQSNLISFLF